MQWQSDIPLILGRPRPSQPLTSTQVSVQLCAEAHCRPSISPSPNGRGPYSYLICSKFNSYKQESCEPSTTLTFNDVNFSIEQTDQVQRLCLYRGHVKVIPLTITGLDEGHTVDRGAYCQVKLICYLPCKVK